MATKKDKAKERYERLTQEIAKEFGDDGKDALKDLIEEKHPQVIFSLPAGPIRDKQAADLVSELRSLSRELLDKRALEHDRRMMKKEKAEKSGKAPAKKTKAKKKEPKEPKEKPTDIIRRTSGKVDRFTYDIGELRNGLFIVKVNRKGRNIFEEDKAPKIYDSERLNKTFTSSDDASFAVSQVINSAMIWYAERGIAPRERRRRSKSVGKGVMRRTSKDRSAMIRDAAEAAIIAKKKKAAKDRKDRLLEEKVKRAGGDRRGNPERKLRSIPRSNPSGLFSFKQSESSAEKQAAKSIHKYMERKETWAKSLLDDKPKFFIALSAYDALENARANYVIAGMKSQADAVDIQKTEFRSQLVTILNRCWRGAAKSGSKTGKSHSEKDHKDKALELAKLGMLSVKAYSSCKKVATTQEEKLKALDSLLTAHQAYSMAANELNYAGASEKEVKKIKKRLAQLRSAILKNMKV